MSNGHEFVMPFPGAETIRCRNCGAGEGSPAGKKPCVPVKSFMAFREAQRNLGDQP